jgi:nitrilase
VMRTSALPAELEASAPADTLVLRGGSAVIAPDGAYVVEPVYDREDVLVTELNLRKIAEESMTLDVTGHYARPDCFRLERVSR